MYQIYHYNNDGQEEALFRGLTYNQAIKKLNFIQKNWGFSFYGMKPDRKRGY